MGSSVQKVRIHDVMFIAVHMRHVLSCFFLPAATFEDRLRVDGFNKHLDCFHIQAKSVTKVQAYVQKQAG
jgi:hypothetical protein